MSNERRLIRVHGGRVRHIVASDRLEPQPFLRVVYTFACGQEGTAAQWGQTRELPTCKACEKAAA